MKDHYKGDFHRFNLKRKSVNLPPVPENLYDEKVAAAQNPKQAKKGTQHLKNPAKKEKEAAKKSTDMIVEEKSEAGAEKQEKVVLTPTDSLFDSHQSDTIDSNLQYMQDNFSFFIPAIDHLKDVTGLLGYLGQKITDNFACIYCQKSFRSLKSIRAHMIEKCHCMMQWQDTDEYFDFYEFPKCETVQQRINETGDFEDCALGYIEPSTGELVLTGDDGHKKIIGIRQYSTLYKQQGHRYLQQQLTTSLMQEQKRLAAIEYQKRVNNSADFIDRRNKFYLHVGKQHNHQKHYRDQNGMVQ